MKLPELQETKFNKRAGKETPVLRVYTTKAGDPMFFMKRGPHFRYMAYPHFFWTNTGSSWPTIRNFQDRICGLGE